MVGGVFVGVFVRGFIGVFVGVVFGGFIWGFGEFISGVVRWSIKVLFKVLRDNWCFCEIGLLGNGDD